MLHGTTWRLVQGVAAARPASARVARAESLYNFMLNTIELVDVRLRATIDAVQLLYLLSESDAHA